MDDSHLGDGDDLPDRQSRLTASVIAMTDVVREKGQRLQTRLQDSDREAPGNAFSEHMIERSMQARRQWIHLLDDDWVESAPLDDVLTAYGLAIEHSFLDSEAMDAANHLRSYLGVPEL